MPVAPSPAEIYGRAVEEGQRRLSMPPLEQVATGFIAGVTIVFGIVALGVVEALVKPVGGPGIARIAGALAFAIGVVFLVVGRTELFSENFFDPVATAIDAGRRAVYVALIRLWGTILVLNLVGGAVLTLILSVEGALPESVPETLVGAAERIASKQWPATLARAVMAGGLLTMLSYLLEASDSVMARVSVAYMVGFLLALGPFDHVVVSALHLVFGLWLGGQIGYGDVFQNLALSAAGNLTGGLLLITLTHTAQVRGR